MTTKLETNAGDTEGYLKFNTVTGLTIKASGEVNIPNLTGPVLGIGQTWQNATASRSLGVTYTNSSGRPIYVSIVLQSPSGGSTTTNLLVDGNVVSANSRAIAGEPDTHVAIIPNGSTYNVPSVGNTTISSWMELR